MSRTNTYLRMRKAGYSASQAHYAAKIVDQWEAITHKPCLAPSNQLNPPNPMTKTYTPGNWQFRQSPSGDLIVQVKDDSKLFPPMIATVSNWRDDNQTVRDEAKANARLIASAPALLEALDDALDYMVDHAQFTGIDVANFIENARAAIASARGQ